MSPGPDLRYPFPVAKPRVHIKYLGCFGALKSCFCLHLQFTCVHGAVFLPSGGEEEEQFLSFCQLSSPAFHFSACIGADSRVAAGGIDLFIPT